ncbi:MAG: DUF448 domain-containing protein [Candidatus Dormiibacterota bacterium]
MADRHPPPGRGALVTPALAQGPIRTCIGCRARASQAGMLRLRWNGVRVVLEGSDRRGPGRGAYLCAKMTCWEAARQRRALARALRLSRESIDHLGLAKELQDMISGSPPPRISRITPPA